MARLGRASRQRPSAGTRVLRPSLPPFSCTSTRIRSPAAPVPAAAAGEVAGPVEAGDDSALEAAVVGELPRGAVPELLDRQPATATTTAPVPASARKRRRPNEPDTGPPTVTGTSLRSVMRAPPRG